MTDNRTTELRANLTARGVEYEADDHKNYAYTYWGDWAYCEPLDAKPGTLGAQCELMLIPATPEQAITATLGSDDEYEVKMDALLCRLTNGKWLKSRAYDLDFMVSCVEEEYETLHAKELAELGSGTCEDVGSAATFKCSECGWYSPVFTFGEGMPRFCPQCGKAVER